MAINSVALVSTVHEEIGLANVAELCAILEHIQPEVIFLEVPAADFDDFYENCRRENLESMAVRQYRESNHVKLVPVDLPAPSEDFHNNNRYLFGRIEKVSRTFCFLIDSNSTYVRTEGFPYLNSERSSKLSAELYEETLSTIKWMNNDPELLAIYRSWQEKNDLREKVMMENIHNYCSGNTFDKGVFFVGAAHRQAIIDIAREQTRADPTRIQWDFAGHMDRHG
jgi:hypothetical protein